MPSKDTAAYWILRFLAGIALLVAAGVGLFGGLFGKRLGGPVSVLMGLYGFATAIGAVGPLTRLAGRRANLQRQWHEAARQTFARASLPRRIYYLLASIAAVDGPMSTVERDAVRHFLLDRFLDPVQADELRTWEAQALDIDDRVGLAARIAGGLDPAELDSLFCWCCLVAFADGKYAEPEHLALQDVAKGLGIPGPRARMLFHLARAQFLKGQEHGDRQRPGPVVNARQRALDTLGLPPDATPEAIRRRHRELVRKFHPDAQPHLGPVAQQEATERFQAIQKAYELLSS